MNRSARRFTSPAARRVIRALPPLLIASAAVGLAACPAAAERLEFDRTQFLAGQWSRLLTGHLVHFGPSHLVWDVVTFAGLGVVAFVKDARRSLAAIASAAVAIPLAIVLLQPNLQTYRGLSGLVCALFGVLAGLLIRERRDAASLLGLAMVGFIAKSVYESAAGHAFFVQSTGSFVPVPLAHVVGVACGLLAAVAWQGRDAHAT